MEMLKFFDLLPEGAREEILKNLCRNATEFTKDEDKEETCRSGDHFLQRARATALRRRQAVGTFFAGEFGAQSS